MTKDHERIVPPEGVLAPRYRVTEPGSLAGARRSLDGSWRFKLFPTADTGTARDSPGEGWDEIRVPGHWQLAGAPGEWPYGKPAYTNILYPIPLLPPSVPVENPTGEYRRAFTVPEEWLRSGRVVLRFEGVDSWFEVAVNGVVLARSHGSRLPSEVDVTSTVVEGENLLAVRVTQWSATTYIEDQDMWWLSGIFRGVSLEHRPTGGIGHVRVSADYDHRTGRGTLCVSVEGHDGLAHSDATVRIPELAISEVAGVPATAPVIPWSAENPRLYDLEVVTAAETVSLRVGFRTIHIDGGVLKLNGSPVKFYGVNRHEFHPTRGRALTSDDMLADVLLMKRHHINAVRTSHYPPHPRFLELCDEYGLYVIDEGDLETHGFVFEGWRGNPTADPRWEPVLVDRVQRMVRRDAHHPSVVVWSLGNEADRGCNVEPMFAEIRSLDPTRPEHYEADKTFEFTDVYSRMYVDFDELELIARRVDGPKPADGPVPTAEIHARRMDLPFMLCEYAHSMGNGPGGLTDYVDIFDGFDRVAGGFVWEWMDQAILVRDESREYFAYGGDFGEELHDGLFVADGLMFPDRTPSPGASELAAVYAPISIRETRQGVLSVRNRYAFTATDHVDARWQVVAAGEVVASGLVDLPVLAPGDMTEVDAATLLAAVTLPADTSAWLVVEATFRDDARPAWAEPSHCLGRGQTMMRATPIPQHPQGPVRVTDDGWKVGPLVIDRSGRLVSIGATPVSVARIDAWRAPTDNDSGDCFGSHPFSDAATWERAGLSRLHESVVRVVAEDDVLTVSSCAAGAGRTQRFAVEYAFRAVDDETADIDIRITPEGIWPGTLARIGWLLALEQPDAGAVSIDWVGQGPGENYPDSRRAARFGRWTQTVGQWQTPYVHPQENGARQGVERATFALRTGRLEIAAAEITVGGRPVEGVTLTARPWSDHALAAAAHTSDLVPDDVLWIHVDAAVHGLGSAVLGPRPVAEATLWPTPATLRLRVTSHPAAGQLVDGA
ncbi:glycoside hydrolase family 2 TIM barrel-domain containing protein [Kribbella sp. NPDC000426]|uniref:glycoside hydrolase family 2 TIM barrel-domain containing protein n=1 Tax=Kribbella sp. NPDC000426 TaxID=3154255 RepID=UPI00332DE83B